MPSEAVVVRAPETQPSRRASWKRNTYLPTYIASTSGTAVTTMPHKKSPKPSCCSPATNFGPEDMPTIAMKTFRPTEFMNHTAGEGMRPNVGLTERSQPKKSPEINAPPEVDKVNGTPP